MKLKLITAPLSLPVTLDEGKSFYRVIGNDDDVEITASLTAAAEMAEQITNLQLSKATYHGYLDSFACEIKLPKSPLITVTSVEYIDKEGHTRPWLDFYYDNLSMPGRLFFPSVPSDVKTDGVNNVAVRFECGYDIVPEAIKTWIKIYGLTIFENRENIVIGASFSAEGKKYYDHLLDSYRIIPCA